MALLVGLTSCTSDTETTAVAERVDTTSGTSDGAGSDTTDGGGSDETTEVTVDTTDGTGPDGGDSGATEPGAEASSRFVAAAINADQAASYLASAPFDDPARGAPFDPALLTRRLAELDRFRGSVDSVRPSTDAHPDAEAGVGPACARAYDLYCEVDLVDGSGSTVASVIVYWFGDGVTDFSIVNRSPAGDPVGIGEARCSPGYRLVHGGHTPDRFDIAVCVDAGGGVEYNGRVRSEDQGIRLDACTDGPVWVALNNQHQYLVDGGGPTSRSRIRVIDPDGEQIVNAPFTTVAFEPQAAPLAC
jgi:hypothetical protein